MKLLKAIFRNALVLATLATIGAGAILVAYADRQAVDSRKASGMVLNADEGVPLNLIAAGTSRQGGAATSREADEGKPPGMALKWDEGVPHNLIAAGTGRRPANREADEGMPPGMTA